jgi:hypothetical protein
VNPRANLRHELQRLALANGASSHSEVLYRGYAWLAVIRLRAERQPTAP